MAVRSSANAVAQSVTLAALPGALSQDEIYTWFTRHDGPHSRFAGLVYVYGVMSNRAEAEAWLRRNARAWNAILVTRHREGDEEQWLLGGAAA